MGRIDHNKGQIREFVWKKPLIEAADSAQADEKMVVGSPPSYSLPLAFLVAVVFSSVLLHPVTAMPPEITALEVGESYNFTLQFSSGPVSYIFSFNGTEDSQVSSKLVPAICLE